MKFIRRLGSIYSKHKQIHKQKPSVFKKIVGKIANVASIVVPPKYKPLISIGKSIIDEFADNDFSITKMRDHFKDSLVGGLKSGKIFEDQGSVSKLFKNFDVKNILN